MPVFRIELIFRHTGGCTNREVFQPPQALQAPLDRGCGLSTAARPGRPWVCAAVDPTLVCCGRIDRERSSFCFRRCKHSVDHCHQICWVWTHFRELDLTLPKSKAEGILCFPRFLWLCLELCSYPPSTASSNSTGSHSPKAKPLKPSKLLGLCWRRGQNKLFLLQLLSRGPLLERWLSLFPDSSRSRGAEHGASAVCVCAPPAKAAQLGVSGASGAQPRPEQPDVP